MFNTPDTVNGCFKFLNDTIAGVGGIFNMLVLVGLVKGAERIVKELAGL